MDIKGFEIHERSDETSITEKEWDELKPGSKWKCIRCGKCCKRDWAVNLTWCEFERMRSDDRAEGLIIDRVEVDEATGSTHPYFLIQGKCPLLNEKGMICTIHPDWLYTCATYPFLLLPDGTILAHKDCSGHGQGVEVSLADIRKNILKERERAGMIVK